MADRELEELKDLARSHQARNDKAMMPSATVQNSDDLPAGKVRVWRPDLRRNMVVDGLIRLEGAEVWLREMPNNQWQILAVNVAESSQVFGETLAAKLQPQGMDEVTPRSIPGNGFVPGRIEPSQKGGLYIHARAFWYDGGYYDDGALTGDPTLNDMDLSSFVPASAGYSRWVAVYFDPLDLQLHAIEGVPVFGSRTFRIESDMDAIALPDGVYPLGGARLDYGQAQWALTDFADRREHLLMTGLRPLVDSLEGLISRFVVDDDGSVVTDDDGNIVLEG